MGMISDGSLKTKVMTDYKWSCNYILKYIQINVLLPVCIYILLQ